MKTYRNLYSRVCDWDNLYLAYRKARKGKRGRPPAATFEYDLEANLNNNVGFRLVSHDFPLSGGNATGRVKTRAEAKRKTA